MPLRRTPPQTPTNLLSDEPISQVLNVIPQIITSIDTQTSSSLAVKPRSQTSNLGQSGSAPNLTDLPNANITKRKRKHGDEQERFMNEMLKLIDSHTERCEIRSNKTDSALVEIHNTMREIMKQNSEIRESIAFVSQQYEDMKTRVALLESERKDNHEHIHLLEERVDDLERLMYNKKLEIKNVPLTSEENEEDLCAIVLSTSRAVGASLIRSDIKEVHCINRKDKPTKIVVDLVNTKVKDNILKRTRQFNSNNKEKKLNSLHLHIKGTETPIYVSDCLPRKTQHLFYLARKFSKEHNFAYCWTTAGQVFLRRSELEKAVVIRCETDFGNLLAKI